METQQKAIIPYQEQIDPLIDMRLAGKLTDEEYKAIRTKFLRQISLLKERIKEPEHGTQDWRIVNFFLMLTRFN